jgi:outer membrane autotransporter protein
VTATIKLASVEYRVLCVSISAALGMASVPGTSLAHDYNQTITGVPGADTQYAPQVDANGNLIYRFQSGDRVSTSTNIVENVTGVSLVGVVSPVVLQVNSNGLGDLSLSTQRAAVGSWGTAFAVDVEQSTLTVNGNASVYAQSDDAVPQSASIGLRVDQSTATFNGNTTITTYTPGYSQAIWAYQSAVTFNGTTTVKAQARGSSTSGIYNSGGGRGNMVFNGDLNVSSEGIHPSDNVHGIYNDNANTRLTVNGNLSLSAASNGSTVFGIRNQGRMTITGDSSITATGPRSAFGIANTYRTASMYFGGNVTINVVNGTGYTPFGLPAAISSTYGLGSSITFAKGVSATINATTESYGINNTGIVNFNDAQAPVIIQAHSSCTSCNVFALSQGGGQTRFAGGLQASATTSGTGGAFVVANWAQSGADAVVDVNSSGSGRVTLAGDIADINLNAGNTATTRIALNTPDSYFKGRVLSFADAGLSTDTTTFGTGITALTFTNGASWIPTGTGTVENDFGAGHLVLGSGAGIDMASNWGAFTHGSIPTYAFRTLVIGSSTSAGAIVDLTDGATFTLLSDVRKGVADEIVFGPGISAFNVSGIPRVKIAYDPALDDTSWVNSSNLKAGVVIPTASPITIIDASHVSNAKAPFSAVQGMAGQWSGTYENALVQFSYVPQVALSADHGSVLLTGIQIVGNGQAGTGTNNNRSSGASGNGPGTASGGGSGGSSGDASGGSATVNQGSGFPDPADDVKLPILRPANGILAAGDAATAAANLWFADDHATSRRAESFRAEPDAQASGVWVDGSGGDFRGSTDYGRAYRQHWTTENLGADTLSSIDAGRNLIGFSYAHSESDDRLSQGRAHLRSESLGVYDTWLSANGYFIDAKVRIGRIHSTYRSFSSSGETTGGETDSTATAVALTTGWHFEGSRGGYIEPQLQLAYGTLSGADYVAANAVRIDRARLKSLTSRAGVWFGKSARLSPKILMNIYGRVSVLHTVGDGAQIEASYDGGSVPLTLPGRRATASEIALGSRLAMSSKVSLFIEAARTSDNTLGGGWHGAGGIRLAL